MLPLVASMHMQILDGKVMQPDLLVLSILNVNVHVYSPDIS